MQKVSVAIAFVLLASCVLLPRGADAQVRLVAHTDVPVFYGAGIDAEVPGRLRLATSIGRLPAGYVSGANAVLMPVFGSKGYTPEVADLVTATIKSSSVWRTTLGWRPLPKAGFVFGLGYTLAGLGGETTGEELLAGATGVPAQAGGGEPLLFKASATLQLLHAELGWTWNLSSNVWLKTGVGMAMTVKANTRVEAQFTPQQPAAQGALRKFETAVEDYLQDTMRSYVHPPHLSIALGFWI